jgi:hypothetical protein
MVIDKGDISTFEVVAQDGSEHWACCPICAEVVGLYYQNAVLNAKCYATGTPIKIVITNGNLTSAGNDIRVVSGGSCATNKIVASPADGQKVIETYDWASNATLKTIPQTFVSANTKLTQMTVSYRPVSIPATNYIMIGIGCALLAAAPLAAKLLKQKVTVSSQQQMYKILKLFLN